MALNGLGHGSPRGEALTPSPGSVPADVTVSVAKHAYFDSATRRVLEHVEYVRVGVDVLRVHAVPEDLRG